MLRQHLPDQRKDPHLSWAVWYISTYFSSFTSFHSSVHCESPQLTSVTRTDWKPSCCQVSLCWGWEPTNNDTACVVFSTCNAPSKHTLLSICGASNTQGMFLCVGPPVSQWLDEVISVVWKQHMLFQQCMHYSYVSSSETNTRLSELFLFTLGYHWKDRYSKAEAVSCTRWRGISCPHCCK